MLKGPISRSLYQSFQTYDKNYRWHDQDLRRYAFRQGERKNHLRIEFQTPEIFPFTPPSSNQTFLRSKQANAT